LRHEDGLVTVVKFQSHGDACPLANALLQLQTTVTALYLVFDDLAKIGTGTIDFADGWTLLLEYMTTSTSLQLVVFQFRHDGLRYFPRHHSIILSLVEQVLHAIVNNTIVCELRFCLGMIYQPFSIIALLNVISSLQELHLDVSDYVLSSAESRLSIVDPLSSNTTIERLKLDVGEYGFDGDVGEISESVIKGLCQNTSLQTLSLSLHGATLVLGQSWSALLQSAIPLCCLVLDHVCFNRDAVEDLMRGLIWRANTIDLELRECIWDQSAIDSMVAFIPTIHKSLDSKLTVWGVDWYPYSGRYR
jgi:hypothetical protein